MWKQVKKDSVFCPKCGFKLKDKEKKTKFCSHCGEKIDANAEICPKCGVRLINPLTNSASDVLNKGKTKADDFSKRYLTAKNFIIVRFAGTDASKEPFVMNIFMDIGLEQAQLRL
jgi:uncharacterized membrane protein YvbJ